MVALAALDTVESVKRTAPDCPVLHTIGLLWLDAGSLTELVAAEIDDVAAGKWASGLLQSPASREIA